MRPGSQVKCLQSCCPNHYLRLCLVSCGSSKLVMSVTALRISIFFLSMRAPNDKWTVKLTSDNRDVTALQKCSRPAAKREVLQEHWWQARYCPGSICACLDSKFGWDAETSSRMESVTCCFLAGLEVLAKISKHCGVGVELEQEPVPVSAASSSPEAPPARKCAWGKAWTEGHRASVCEGRCCALWLGCLSGIQRIRLGALYLPWAVASRVPRGSEPSKVRHWEPE